MKLTYKQAIKKTTEFLTEHLLTDNEKKSGDTKVTIYDFFGNEEGKVAYIERDKRPWCGVRVAEVSIVTEYGMGGMSGASYMQQSDFPFGAAFCRQVELCILALIEDWNDGDEKETDEQFEILKWVIEQELKSTKK